MRTAPSKLPPPSPLKLLFLIIFSTTTFFLLYHRFLLHCPTQPSTTSTTFFHSSSLPTTTSATTSGSNPPPPPPTNLEHIFFAIASSARSFPKRIPFLSLWYLPNTTRALLFLDRAPSSPPHPPLPFFVSSDTSRFPYSYPHGHRSAIRVARVVKEAFDLNQPSQSDLNENINHSNYYSGSSIRWYVFGDDDTVFFPDNIARVLGKYDHTKWYYIGGNSESFDQNLRMSFGMAFGGGGFAISSSLAKALSPVLDSCLMRYPHLYGSDHRICACVSELGVQLTHEPGFHQFDVRGDLLGLLATHPLSPLLSLHHLEIVEPIFPKKNLTEAVQHLYKAARIDPGRVLQQTVCYDHSSNLTISVAWGYAVHVFQGNLLLPEILASQRTFTPWRRRGINVASQYGFDTRDYPQDPCKRPVVFFLEDVASGTGRVWSKYRRHVTHGCPRIDAIENLNDVKVFSKKLHLDAEKVMAPRRDCCDIMHPFMKSMVIDIRQCAFNELIAMNP